MPNIQPIFTRIADIQGGAILTTAAADYVGQNVFNTVVYQSDQTNGGYVQRIRFKALGTNVTTVVRIYVNNGNAVNAPSSNVPQSLSGVGAASSGSLLTQNIVFKVASVDQWGSPSGYSVESANIAVTGPTANITLNWNASSNSNTYIIALGKTPGSEERFFLVTGANTYNLTTLPNTNLSQIGAGNAGNTFPNYLYGEVSLPATTASTTAGTQDIDYPMNLALPPGYKILVGLGATVAAGWMVTVMGGKY